MIVKDLFDKIDFETLWDYYYENKIKEDGDTPEQIERAKLCHQYAYLQMKKIEPIKSDNDILIFHKYLDDFLNDEENEFDDVSLYYLDEIKEGFNIVKEFEEELDFSKLSFNEIRDFLINKTFHITSYAFEFSRWNEILGYNVHEKSMLELGEVASLSSVFYEMTFCGFEEEDIQEELEEIKDRANEVHEMIENKDFSQLKSIEEIFPDWEDYKPTEEDNKRTYLINLKNKKIIYFILKDIIETN